jgi:peptidoglycan/xylan/chitin deacetylase (PgdA/CDA1 family)
VGVALVLTVNAATLAAALPDVPTIPDHSSGVALSSNGRPTSVWLGAVSAGQSIQIAANGPIAPAVPETPPPSTIVSPPSAPNSPAPSVAGSPPPADSPAPPAGPTWPEAVPSSAVPAMGVPPFPAGPTAAPTPIPDREYRVPILMYHRVLPADQAADNLPGLVVTPELFGAQMQAMHDAGWHTIVLRDLAGAMRAGRTLPPRTFVVTFDDGWADGYDYAYPILRRLGYVGVFFVISNRIDGPGSLTGLEMVDLEATGNEIGNHTANHVSLSSVKYGRVKNEVETASARISQIIHKRPASLSYPMGGVAPYTVRAVGEVDGIQIAVTTRPGVTETWLSRMALPRVRISSSTRPDLLVQSLSSRVGI